MCTPCISVVSPELHSHRPISRGECVHEALRTAWQAGVVLTGVSAGSICWHVGGTTDPYGPGLRPVTDGLGFLPCANGVHYDTVEQRRPLFESLVQARTLPLGYATDDGVGLLYHGTELVEAVSEENGKAAYRVEPGPEDNAPRDPAQHPSAT